MDPLTSVVNLVLTYSNSKIRITRCSQQPDPINSVDRDSQCTNARLSDGFAVTRREYNTCITQLTRLNRGNRQCMIFRWLKIELYSCR